jgi:hypothetical protein
MIVELVDKLVDRAIQLLTYRKQMRTVLRDTYVAPVFAEFEQVHSAYLESFARYRDLIQGTKDPNWIRSLQATLEKDNLFSANCRTKVLRLAEVEHDEMLGPFVRGISEYLLGARLVDPLGKAAFPRMIQRWRQSLFRTLGEIADENWQLVIDPGGAAPPLIPEEMDEELERRRVRYPTDSGSGTKQDATKRACALWALDAVVGEMQDQYDQVCCAYAELRAALSK